MNRWNQNNQPEKGRIIVVTDGVEGYWTPLGKGERWTAAFREFADGYDHGGIAGEITARCSFLADGQEKETAEMDFNDGGKITSFRGCTFLPHRCARKS